MPDFLKNISSFLGVRHPFLVFILLLYLEYRHDHKQNRDLYPFQLEYQF